MFRVKVTGVKKTNIEIENTITKERVGSEVDKPKKDVLGLLGVVWLGGEGEYTDDVDDISRLLTNLRHDQKLQGFCDMVEKWISG